MTEKLRRYVIFNRASGVELWEGVATDEHEALRQLDEEAHASEPSSYGYGNGGSGLDWDILPDDQNHP